jgi:hypothetical protein
VSVYIHHVSGRLRLKLEQIRRQPRRAQEIQIAVGRIKGITSVESNTITGSLLVRYDADEVKVETILHAMREMGLLSTAAGVTVSQQRAFASLATDKVLDVLVEKLIERSVVAIIGALL